MVAVAAAAVAGCSTNSHNHSAATTSASAEPTSTTRHVARGFHSDVADVYLPRGATMDPYSSTKMEIWQANELYGSAVRDMNALLPVNQPLNGQPWCGSKTGADDKSTYWLWASPTGGVEVSVSEITGTTMITIGTKSPTAEPCSSF